MKGETQTNGVLVKSTLLHITISLDMPFVPCAPKKQQQGEGVRQNVSNAHHCPQKIGSSRFLWRCGSVATRSPFHDARCPQGHPSPKLGIPEATIPVRSMAPIVPMPQIPR